MADPANPLDDEDDDSPENPVIKEIREAQKRAEKQAKDAQKERDAMAAQLAEFQAKEKENQVGEVFTKVGLSPKHARLFLKDSPEGETTEDSVRAWAEANDLAPKSSEDTSPAATYTPGPAGVAPQAGNKISEEELDKLMRTDPAAAVAKANRGEVDWSEATLRISS
jgi:hypothetical protein